MFRRRLHFYDFLAAGDDEVHVHIGARVFLIAQVEQNGAIYNADAGCSHVVANWRHGQRAGRDHGGHGEAHGDKSPGYGRGARSSVGLDHVAVDEQRALAQLVRVGDGTQRAPNQSLDLMRATARSAFRDLAWATGQGGAGQHAVFGGDPAFPAVAQELGDGVFDGGGADYTGVAQFDEAGAFGGRDVVGNDFDRAHLVKGAIVGAIDHRGRLYRPRLRPMGILTKPGIAPTQSPRRISAAKVDVLDVIDPPAQKAGREALEFVGGIGHEETEGAVVRLRG